MKKLKDKKEPYPHHVFLDEDIGVMLSNDFEDYEKLSYVADDFEYLIGNLNQVLEKMYGCQICYDKSEEPSDHIKYSTADKIAIPEGKTLFDGFAIFVVETKEKMEDA